MRYRLTLTSESDDLTCARLGLSYVASEVAKGSAGGVFEGRTPDGIPYRIEWLEAEAADDPDRGGR